MSDDSRMRRAVLADPRRWVGSVGFVKWINRDALRRIIWWDGHESGVALGQQIGRDDLLAEQEAEQAAWAKRWRQLAESPSGAALRHTRNTHHDWRLWASLSREQQRQHERECRDGCAQPQAGACPVCWWLNGHRPPGLRRAPCPRWDGTPAEEPMYGTGWLPGDRWEEKTPERQAEMRAEAAEADARRNLAAERARARWPQLDRQRRSA